MSDDLKKKLTMIHDSIKQLTSLFRDLHKRWSARIDAGNMTEEERAVFILEYKILKKKYQEAKEDLKRIREKYNI